MARYVGLLRAVNVGGRKVLMEELCEVVRGIGYTDVSTFIASGNVLFTAGRAASTTVERTLEGALEDHFGFPVPVFVRTGAEMNAVRQVIRPEAVAWAVAVNVGFVRREPDAAAVKKLLALRTEQDEITVIGREVYWFCVVRHSQSARFNTSFDKVLGQPITFRNANTVRKLTDLLGGG